MRSLEDWVRRLSGTKMPVLRKTIEDLAVLKANEDNVTARDLQQLALRDPLMALRVLRFSQSRLTQRQPTEVTTVEHAVMMHGLTNFFREMRDLQAIEDQLRDQPYALDGALRVISRACHAASYARNFSALRHDMDTDEVVISALLHDLAELLLWSTAPAAAVQIEFMVQHQRGLRSASAQRACLGFELVDLQLALAREWKLPNLLQSLMDDHHASHPRALTVTVSVRLARHSANGWNDAALPDDYAAIQKLLNLPPEGVLRWVRQATIQAARTWGHTGVRPAAAWLPLLGGDWPEEEKPGPTEHAPDLIVRVLQQLTHLPPQAAEPTVVSALVFYALHAALGLRRMWLGQMNETAQKVETCQSVFLEPGLLPGELMFELDSRHLFARLMGKVQGVWLNAAQRGKLAPLLPEALRGKLTARDSFAMSIHAKGKPFALIYADGGSQRAQLSEADYGSFKSLCLAAAQAFERAP